MDRLLKPIVDFNAFPMYGYVYDELGYHHGSIELSNDAVLFRFIDTEVRRAMHEKRQVIITNHYDNCCLHVEGGELIWPTLAMLAAYQQSKKD